MARAQRLKMNTEVHCPFLTKWPRIGASRLKFGCTVVIFLCACSLFRNYQNLTHKSFKQVFSTIASRARTQGFRRPTFRKNTNLVFFCLSNHTVCAPVHILTISQMGRIFCGNRFCQLCAIQHPNKPAKQKHKSDCVFKFWVQRNKGFHLDFILLRQK